MKTQDEIAERVERIKGDFFGFGYEALCELLDADHIKPYLKELDVEWNQTSPLDAIKSYMEFAWNKVSGHRGISAARSVEKMAQWLWAMEDYELMSFAQDDSNYMNYGAPILRKICEKYEIDMPVGEEWFENMSVGKPCRTDCDNGCGK